MRQGQPQNRQRSRGRGNNNNRNNNNRNQLNRSMESNGPDVRIRGTAAHIAEKYATLANDAQTAGDTVGAQSYWQFAEHYNRLVAAAQASQQQAREEQEAKREARGENADSGNENSDGRSEGRGRNDRNRNRNRNRNREENDDEAAQASEDKSLADTPQPTLDEMPAEVVLNQKPVEDGATEEAPAKPKRAKRPRKPKEDLAAAAADDAGGLPAFVTGSE